MNKRIKELIGQCTFIYDDLVYDGTDSYMKTSEYFDKEKFAELILKEAINTIQSVGDKASNDIPFEVTDLFVSQLRQRFGVEE